MPQRSTGDGSSREGPSSAAPVVVRPAAPADLPALARLPASQPQLARYGMDAAGMEGALAAALSGGDELVVAERSGVALGLAWWQPRGAFGRSPYLRLLAVAPAATGAGVGSRLMDAVEAAAFTSSNDLFLLVSADNVAARRFYERRGFVAVGTIPDYVLPGIDEVAMRLRRPGRPH